MNMVLHLRTLLLAALLICVSLICIVVPLSWQPDPVTVPAMPLQEMPIRPRPRPTRIVSDPPRTRASAQLTSYTTESDSIEGGAIPVHTIDYPDVSLDGSSVSSEELMNFLPSETSTEIPTDRRIDVTAPLTPTEAAPPERSLPPQEDLEHDEDETISILPSPRVGSSIERGWPLPRQLMAQIDELSAIPGCMDWSLETRQQLAALAAIPQLEDPSATDVFRSLKHLAREAGQLAVSSVERETYSMLLRAQYALVRRLAVWHHTHLVCMSPPPNSITIPSSDDVLRRFGRAFARLRRLQHFEAWSEFLLLEEGASVYRNLAATDDERRHIARRILRRLASRGLTQRQRAYFQAPVYRELQDALRHWATDSVDYAALLHDLEEFESGRDIGVAHRVANNCQLLLWSHHPRDHELGKRVDMHYRNANVRLAVSEPLLNRLLPEQEDFTTNVDDVIVGADVRGMSHVSQKLRVALVPDPSRIHIQLESHGVVASDTAAYKGRSIFWNDGISVFDAQKRFMLDRRGIWTTSAEADADTRTFMRGMRSGYENIPIVSDIARTIALQGHEQNVPQANFEAERKLEHRVRERMDRDVDIEVEKAQARFQSRALMPLEKLHLYPEPVTLQTTEQRVVARYRIAGSPQLGAFTPRPQAQSNSWLSVQVHQSVLNNVIDRLELDGRTFGLQELNDKLKDLFGTGSESTADELPDDVTIKFADHDAVGIEFDDDRVAVELHISVLTSGRNRAWRTFAVRVHFVPYVDGLDARFVRDPDGVVELASPRLRFRDQVALRGIFSKVFAVKRTYPILPRKLIDDHRLGDLEASQFLVRDGWLGLALSPNASKQRNTAVRGRIQR